MKSPAICAPPTPTVTVPDVYRACGTKSDANVRSGSKKMLRKVLYFSVRPDTVFGRLHSQAVAVKMSFCIKFKLVREGNPTDSYNAQFKM